MPVRVLSLSTSALTWANLATSPPKMRGSVSLSKRLTSTNMTVSDGGRKLRASTAGAAGADSRLTGRETTGKTRLNNKRVLEVKEFKTFLFILEPFKVKLNLCRSVRCDGRSTWLAERERWQGRPRP